MVGTGADDVSTLEKKCDLSNTEKVSTDCVLLEFALGKGVGMLEAGVDEVKIIRGLYLNLDKNVPS